MYLDQRRQQWFHSQLSDLHFVFFTDRVTLTGHKIVWSNDK